MRERSVARAVDIDEKIVARDTSPSSLLDHRSTFLPFYGVKAGSISKYMQVAFIR